MGTWHEYIKSEGTPPEWPYPVKYGEEQVIEADIAVIGGGIAGCWAAISAARNGAKVVILEKGDVNRSGLGGPGCDHWCNVPANPHSRVDPDEWAIKEMNALGRFSNGIGIEIQCREDYDTLLEMEQMGGQIRDVNDEFVGVEGRYDDTKFMFSPRYSRVPGYGTGEGWDQPDYNPADSRNNVVIRIWGAGFKPLLKKECKRLGVDVRDRIMVTSLLNEGGKVGGRVVGATGINTRTGEFIIVKAKATIISTGGSGRLWDLDMEHGGHSTMSSRNESSDSVALAWRAGATVTMQEATRHGGIAGGLRHKWYTGGGDASYENVPLVDDNNKVLPVPIQGWSDGGAMYNPIWPGNKVIIDGIADGTYKLPFWGDFAGMKPEESDATWYLMLTQESTTNIMVKKMDEDGFDNHKDQVMNYFFNEYEAPLQYREMPYGGGLMHDWDLMTDLEGLYAAGTSTFMPEDHSYAAATGRYAGRKAAAFVKDAEGVELDRAQIDREKERVLAPTKLEFGIDWKELHNGLARIMQYFVGKYLSEKMFDMALDQIAELERLYVPRLYAPDPHKLLRCLEDLSLIEHAKIVINAMRERRFSSPELGLERLDYPEVDEEDLNNYLTLKLTEDGEIKFDRLPVRFWGNMKEQYEAHNADYTGVYHEEA